MKPSAEINPRQLDNLEREFLDFLQDVSLRELGYREKPHVHLGRAYGPNFAHLQWGDVPLAETIDATRQLCPNVSDKQINRVLIQLMMKIFEDQAVSQDADPEKEADLESILEILDTAGLRQELLQVVQFLRDQVRPQIVFVPIEGLDLTTSELAVGTVTLHRRHSQSEFDKVLQNLEEQAGRELTSMREDLKEVKCYATVRAIGDSNFARDEARRRVTQAIHILNLYLSSTRHQPHWASICVAPVVINQPLPADDSERVASGFSHTFPVGWSLKLDRKRKKHLLNWGLEEVNACFHPDSHDKIARRIRRAVTWYSKAVDANSPGEKFVNLSIALESLLIGDEGKGLYATTGSITQNLKERVAFLLGDSLESRLEIGRATRDLYGLRSGIVHSGKQIDSWQLDEMDRLVGNAILAFIKHDFPSWAAFREWIARQKFGSESLAAETTASDDKIQLERE